MTCRKSYTAEEEKYIESITDARNKGLIKARASTLRVKRIELLAQLDKINQNIEYIESIGKE